MCTDEETEEGESFMRNQDQFRGCLLGGAAGDALGYEVEFKNERQIFSRYGDGGGLVSGCELF